MKNTGKLTFKKYTVEYSPNGLTIWDKVKKRWIVDASLLFRDGTLSLSNYQEGDSLDYFTVISEKWHPHIRCRLNKVDKKPIIDKDSKASLSLHCKHHTRG